MEIFDCGKQDVYCCFQAWPKGVRKVCVSQYKDRCAHIGDKVEQVRYAMCPICLKIVKLAMDGDLPICWNHDPGIQMKEMFTTSNKIMVASLVNDKIEYREYNEEDVKKQMATFISKGDKNE